MKTSGDLPSDNQCQISNNKWKMENFFLHVITLQGQKNAASLAARRVKESIN